MTNEQMSPEFAYRRKEAMLDTLSNTNCPEKTSRIEELCHSVVEYIDSALETYSGDVQARVEAIIALEGINKEIKLGDF